MVVIGGGIAGLAAAWELSGQGVDEVTVVEAQAQLGGALRTVPFAGRAVDVAADGFLARRPEAVTLCREIGLGEELVAPGTSGAGVWVRGRPRPLPDDLVLGIPTRFWPVARAGILGIRGSVRLLADAVAPRPDRRRPMGDRALGPLVERKLGRRVVETLADPLLGGIHAGSVTDMSTAALFPALLAASQSRGSLMRALRRATGGGTSEDPPAPAFYALRGGMASLVTELAHKLAARGVTLRTQTAAVRLERAGAGGSTWIVWTAPTAGSADGHQAALAADGIVIATAAPAAATLLEDHDPQVATVLRGVEHASVAVVTLQYPKDASFANPQYGTGILLPRGTRLNVGGPRSAASAPEALVTACTYLSRKWPHLAPSAAPGSSSSSEGILIRASVGRLGDERFAALGDDALVAQVTEEVGTILGTSDRPLEAMVTRWPDAFPQYRVHHLLRVAAIEAATRRLPALALAGRTYRGVGIPACIASGRDAARAVLDALSDPQRPERPAATLTGGRTDRGNAAPPAGTSQTSGSAGNGIKRRR